MNNQPAAGRTITARRLKPALFRGTERSSGTLRCGGVRFARAAAGKTEKALQRHAWLGRIEHRISNALGRLTNLDTVEEKVLRYCLRDSGTGPDARFP